MGLNSINKWNNHNIKAIYIKHIYLNNSIGLYHVNSWIIIHNKTSLNEFEVKFKSIINNLNISKSNPIEIKIYIKY